MNDARKDFRESLLEMEHITPALQERYRKEIQAMFEKTLTRPMRLGWIATGIGGLGFTILFGTTAILVPKEFPILGRLMFVAGAVFGLAWAVLATLIVRRGSIDLRSHGKAVAGLAWIFVVIVSTGTLLLAGNHRDNIVGVRMICSALVFLVMAAVIMILYKIQESELKIREKLLEIELRMTRLAEKLERRD